MDDTKNMETGWSDPITKDGLIIRTRSIQPGENPQDFIPKEPEELRQAKALATMYGAGPYGPGGEPPKLFFGAWVDAVRAHNRGDTSMLARLVKQCDQPLPKYARDYVASLLDGRRELKRDGHIKMREADLALIQRVAAEFWLTHELAKTTATRSEKTAEILQLARMTGRPESTVRRRFNFVLDNIIEDSSALKRKRLGYRVTRVVDGKKLES